MQLQIFDVEHGACALLTCDNGARMMIDCGHNANTGWRPGRYLQSQGVTSLDMLAITNYDEDHVSGIEDLCDNIDVRWLWRNTSVTPSILRQLKTEDGMGRGVDRLVHEMSNTFTGNGQAQQPFFQNVERASFFNSYPAFTDENNLSMVVYLRCNGIGVLFSGDLEQDGWRALTQNPDFQAALSRTSILVASHHGRESGCCNEVQRFCNPFYVVISDKGYMYDTQRTMPFYQRLAKGGPFRQEERKVLTTRCDGLITFRFENGSWYPY